LAILTDLQFTFQSDEFQLRCSMWMQNCCIFKYYKCKVFPANRLIPK